MDLNAVGWTMVFVIVAAVNLRRLARQRDWAQLAVAAALWLLGVFVFWQGITETRLISPTTVIHRFFDNLFGHP